MLVMMFFEQMLLSAFLPTPHAVLLLHERAAGPRRVHEVVLALYINWARLPQGGIYTPYDGRDICENDAAIGGSRA